MARFHGIIAVLGALVLASVATGAYAQRAPVQAQQAQQAAQATAFTVDPSVWQPSGSRSMQWNGKGRWGLNLNFDEPTTREMQGKDVAVGPTYKLTRRLQIRSQVNLGDESSTRILSPNDKPQPRVRLETLFRF